LPNLPIFIQSKDANYDNLDYGKYLSRIKPDFMRMRKLLISFLIFLASLVGINDAAIAAVGQNGATPGNFDYYVLSLSWAPEYCYSHRDDSQECSGQGESFVLHGLWPQYAQGGYPENCSTTQLTEDDIAKHPNVYPSTKLYIHEWEKHGTCTGLEPDSYLGLAQQAFQSITIPDKYVGVTGKFNTTPDQLVSDFVNANQSLDASKVVPICTKGRFLSEVNVCYAKDGSGLVSCGDDVVQESQNTCTSASIIVSSPELNSVAKGY